MQKRIISLAAAALLLLATIGCAWKAMPQTGAYLIDVTLEGGSGKASIQSPARLDVFGDGTMQLTVVWSSANYDYMLVDGERYDAEIIDGHSVFVIPVKTLGKPLDVVADTVAMSMPHEIVYTITFDIASQKPAS